MSPICRRPPGSRTRAISRNSANLVYPALIAAVGDSAHPSWRGVVVGVYRLWRDLGYVAGALLAGVLSDLLGSSAAIRIVGIVTALSGIVVAMRFDAGGRQRS